MWDLSLSLSPVHSLLDAFMLSLKLPFSEICWAICRAERRTSENKNRGDTSQKGPISRAGFVDRWSADAYQHILKTLHLWGQWHQGYFLNSVGGQWCISWWIHSFHVPYLSHPHPISYQNILNIGWLHSLPISMEYICSHFPGDPSPNYSSSMEQSSLTCVFSYSFNARSILYSIPCSWMLHMVQDIPGWNAGSGWGSLWLL